MQQALNLLREYTDYKELNILKEQNDGGSNDVYITGIFLQGNIQNRNGRNYPTEMLTESVSKYVNQKVKSQRALGELNHPPGVEINLDRVALLITELNMQGNNGLGKAKLLNTPKGQIAKALVEGGVNFGVSTRGLGKIDKDSSGSNIVSNFDLVAVDIVSDPSAPDAYVSAVYEGLQYYIDETTSEIRVLTNKELIEKENKKLDNIARVLEEIKEALCSLPTKQEQKKKSIIDIITKNTNNL
jgi:hypothetical protein